jgi:hypothetical protein
MTAAVMERPAASVTRGTTLDDAIARTWEGLASHRAVTCPVCHGHMQPRYGASGAAPVGGRCADCGSTLG